MTEPAASSVTTRRGIERLQLGLGALLIALVAISGARDLNIGLHNWDRYTPVGPSDPLPEFAVQLDDGTKLRSSDLQGQVSLLTFWATWCHACGLEMPILAAIDEHYESSGADLRIYGVNRDSGPLPKRRAAVETYLDEARLDVPQIYDNGQLARAFEVEGIPHMVLVDRRGQIRHVHLGRVSEGKLREEIDALLAEPAP